VGVKQTCIYMETSDFLLTYMCINISELLATYIHKLSLNDVFL